MEIEEEEVAAFVTTAQQALGVLQARVRAVFGAEEEPLADPDQLTRDPSGAMDEALVLFQAGDVAGSLELLNRAIRTLRWRVIIDLQDQPAGPDTGERPASMRVLAGALVRAAIVQRAGGVHDEAMRSATRAMELFLGLPPEDAADWVALCIGMTHLVPHLNRLERGRLALGVASAVVFVHRRVAEADPSRRAGLATALAELAAQHDHLGEVEAGLEVRREVVALSRAAGDGPAAARAMTALSGRLAELKRGEEAVAVAREAQIDRVELVSVSQAEANLELAERLSKAGRHAEAITIGGQAIEVLRRRMRPGEESERGFAGELPAWARILDAAGRRDEQVAALRECVERLRAWPEDASTRMSYLVVLAHEEWESGRQEEGHGWVAEAVELARSLAAQDDRRRGELVSRLGTQGQYFVFAERYTESLAPFREALELQRILAREVPEEEPGLAECLFNLVIPAMALRDGPQIIHLLQELVPLRRRLADRDPKQRGEFVRNLNDLGRFLRRGRDLPGALAAYQELAEWLRPLAEADPASWRAPLVDALHEVGSTLISLRRPADAQPIYQEALALLPTCDPPAEVLPWRLHFEAAGMYLQNGDPAAALAALEGSAAEDLDDRAEVARGRSKVLTKLGRDEEARGAMAEAAELYWEVVQADPDGADRLRQMMEEYLELEPAPSETMRARARALGIEGA